MDTSRFASSRNRPVLPPSEGSLASPEGLERAFRAASGRLVAALTRRFGVEHFAQIESAVQEAGLRALERCESREPREGRGEGTRGSLGPEELERWLLRVAHNVVVDALRRERREAPLRDQDQAVVEPATPELDDELRLVFLCCHPVLPRAAQIALTLRVAFGLSTPQIARGFLSDERTIAQRIVRAKQRLREERARFELPEPDEVPGRLEAILDVLYLVFNEGYATTGTDAGIDAVLCSDALRLVRLLTDDPRWTTPRAEALRALFCFHVARESSRCADDGGLLLLHEQDRRSWDPELLTEGFLLLGRSARGNEISRFHLEAGIAACHARARSHDATDWVQVLALYDALREDFPSFVVDVNRAFAVAMVRGALAGLDELDAIPERDLVSRHPYALATYAELYASCGRAAEARAFLDRALAQQSSSAAQALLRRKRAGLPP